MRTHFCNLTRPERVSESLMVALPGLTCGAARDAVAVVYGYRDWQELDAFTATYDGPPSMLPGDLDADADGLSDAYAVDDRQKAAFCRFLGEEHPFAEAIYERVFESHLIFPLKAVPICHVPEGSRMFKGMVYDRFLEVRASDDYFAEWEYAEDGIYFCLTHLGEEETVASLTKRFIANLEKRSGAGYAAAAAAALAEPATHETSAQVDQSSGRAVQRRSFRLFALNKTRKRIRGFATIDCELTATLNAGARLAITVRDTFMDTDIDAVESALASSFDVFLSATLELLLWSRTDASAQPIELVVQSRVNCGTTAELAVALAELMIERRLFQLDNPENLTMEVIHSPVPAVAVAVPA